MVAMKFSWIILLALFVAVVYCGNSQSQKKVPYQQLTGYTKSDCNAGMDVVCKNKALAEYCDILKLCKEYMRKKNMEAYSIG